jgi:tetratricopeptide (TPR) repeat protein
MANEFLLNAMECYRHTVELNGFDVAAHHGYGAMLMYFGKYEDAGRQFLQVLRLRNSLSPSMRSNYYADTDLLGQCLLLCGHIQEAAAIFREANALQPAPPDAALHLRAAEAVLARRNAAHPAITGSGKEAADSATGRD